MIDAVKKQNKATRAQFEREVESKTELEHYLKKAVKKVINERKKNDEKNKGRQGGTKFYITALDSQPALKGGNQDENELSQEERERVIEILLGQDKVISLLYDRPPAAANNAEVAAQGASNPMFGDYQMT